jgi:hypothetical protein
LTKRLLGESVTPAAAAGQQAGVHVGRETGTTRAFRISDLPLPWTFRVGPQQVERVLVLAIIGA